MNESQLTAAFGRSLPEDIYVLKVSLRRGCKVGVADAWYSGAARDLWIEWKLVKSNPRTLDPTKLLSKNQLDWCVERRQQGRNVIIVVKTPKGYVSFDPLQLSPIPSKEVEGVAWTKEKLRGQVAEYLRSREDRDLASLCSTLGGGRRSDPAVGGPGAGQQSVSGHCDRTPVRAASWAQRPVPAVRRRQSRCLPRPEHHRYADTPEIEPCGWPAETPDPVPKGRKAH